ncbi:MAG: hypothetical protein SOW94_01480, partial [Erysipelotrichaceae bacterium]|nr:hypothetical protein [Erysipelotrichaceae bacterium]
TKITASLNGNNYITNDMDLETDLSDSKLIGMKIDGIEQKNITCCNRWKADDGIHLVFRNYSHAELVQQNLNAKLEYIAMMGDIEL